MTNFINKKILILGANAETVPLIETAKQMGVFVLVTDNNPNAFAKKFADQAFNVDGMDVDGLVALAKREHVDGVLVGVADRLVEPYQKICNELEFPCYSNDKLCKLFTDKGFFNNVCEEYDIPIIPKYNLSENLENDILNNISFPVFVKPVDSNSGKGMSICFNKDEIPLAVKKALENSKSKRFIVDELMECDDMFIYYTFKDGEIFVSATADRFTSKEQGSLSKIGRASCRERV